MRKTIKIRNVGFSQKMYSNLEPVLLFAKEISTPRMKPEISWLWPHNFGQLIELNKYLPKYMGFFQSDFDMMIFFAQTGFSLAFLGELTNYFVKFLSWLLNYFIFLNVRFLKFIHIQPPEKFFVVSTLNFMLKFELQIANFSRLYVWKNKPYFNHSNSLHSIDESMNTFRLIFKKNETGQKVDS